MAFPRGRAGLHQISNQTDAAIRVLMISTMNQPEVVEYPDSGKLAANDARGETMLLCRPGETLDYWDGEE